MAVFLCFSSCYSFVKLTYAMFIVNICVSNVKAIHRLDLLTKGLFLGDTIDMNNQLSNSAVKLNHFNKIVLKIAFPFCLITVFTLYKATTSADVIYAHSHNIIFYGFCLLMVLAFTVLAYIVFNSFGVNHSTIELDHKKD